MRVLFKTLLAAVTAAMTTAAMTTTAVAQQPKLFAGDPESIDWLFERIVFEQLIEQPTRLSSLRLLEPYGIENHNDDWPDFSPQGTAASLRMARRHHRDLQAFDRATLDGDTQVSYDVMNWLLELDIDGAPFAYHNYPVNQLFGVQNYLPSFMATNHHIGDLDDAEAYVARLVGLEDVFDDLSKSLALRAARDIVPPAFVFDRVIAEVEGFIGQDVEANILYSNLARKLGGLVEAGTLTNAQRARLQRDARTAIVERVYPAYRQLLDDLRTQGASVTDNHGAWALPDGEAFYAWCIRRHTTTDMSAGQIHDLGLAEVARIQAEMDAILTAQGYADGSVGERMNALDDEDRFLYPNTDAGREQILARYREIIETIQARVPEYFDITPAAGVEVQRVPEFRQAGAPGAYYQSPALDGSRPGVFYANLRDTAEVAKFGMKTLTVHEAVPGHHFQIAIQQELQGLPTFRTINGFTAFAEGWALYTERLAKEMGLYDDDPFGDLGRLQAELFRAVRLVVDTGIHDKRWSRERAIDYMADNTGMARSDVVSEIERYFVLPGQALAYKIGMIRILELREQARDALGEDFDLKGFHNVVLMSGSVPLDVLAGRVQAWVAQQQRGN